MSWAVDGPWWSTCSILNPMGKQLSCYEGPRSLLRGFHGGATRVPKTVRSDFHFERIRQQLANNSAGRGAGEGTDGVNPSLLKLRRGRFLMRSDWASTRLDP